MWISPWREVLKRMYVSIELHGFVAMEVVVSKEPSYHKVDN